MVRKVEKIKKVKKVEQVQKDKKVKTRIKKIKIKKKQVYTKHVEKSFFFFLKKKRCKKSKKINEKKKKRKKKKRKKVKPLRENMFLSFFRRWMECSAPYVGLMRGFDAADSERTVRPESPTSPPSASLHSLCPQNQREGWEGQREIPHIPERER